MRQRSMCPLMILLVGHSSSAQGPLQDPSSFVSTSLESVYSKFAENEGREAAELRRLRTEVQQAETALAAVSSQKDRAERVLKKTSPRQKQ